jgi:hypothetical protein
MTTLTIISTIGNRVLGNGHAMHLEVVGKNISYWQDFQLSSSGGVLDTLPQTKESSFEVIDGESVTINLTSGLVTSFQPFSYIVKDEYGNQVSSGSYPISSKQYTYSRINTKEYGWTNVKSTNFSWSVATKEQKTNTFVYTKPIVEEIIPVNIENISSPTPEIIIPIVQTPEIIITPPLIESNVVTENKKSITVPLLVIAGAFLL